MVVYKFGSPGSILVAVLIFYKWRVNDLTKRQKELEQYIEQKVIAENELKLIQERYELAVKGSTDGIWDWNLVTDQVYLSPQWKNMLGFEDRELPNLMSTFQERLHPFDKQRANNEIENYLINGGKFDTEFRLQKKDNSYTWFRARGKAVRDKNRKALRLSGVITDISMRKKAEENLRESRLKMQQILDNALDAVLSADEKGFITLWNDQAEIIFGWKKDEAIGKRISDLIIPSQYKKSHESGIRSYISTGEHKMLNRRVEITAISKSGVEFPVELTITPIVSSDGISFSAFIRDITERKEWEEKLRNDERLFKIITSGVSDLIVILDLEGRRIYASDSYRKFFGEESLVEGSDSFAEIHPEDLEKVRGIFQKTIDAGEGQRGEFRFLLSDGSVRYIESQGNIIFDDDGKPFRVVVVSRDITDYKTAEMEILKLNKELENRIRERTLELEETNQSLQTQISVREKVERVQNAIYQISEAIHKSPDIKSLFAAIHGIVGKMMSAKNFYIALYDPKTDIVSFPYRIDEVNPVTKSRKFRKGVTEYVLKTGAPLLANYDDILKLHEAGLVEQSGDPAPIWLGVPLIIHKRPLGVMAVQDYHEEKVYGENEKQLLMYISEQVAYAVEKKSNEESEKKRVELVLENRNVLIELSQMDSGIFEESLNKILSSTARAINIERVGFWRLDNDSKSLKCEMLYSLSKNGIDEDSKGTSLPATFPGRADSFEKYLEALKANRPLVSFDSQSDEGSGIADSYLKPLGIASMMDVPVWFRGDVVGVVCLEHIGTNREFILEEEDFMASIANMISLSMETSTRRTAEENLKASERQYKLVIDNANDAIIVAQDGTIKFANPRSVGITGFSIQEFESKPFIEFIHPDDRGIVLDNYVKRMKGEEVVNSYPFRVMRKDGSFKTVEINAVLISWLGKPATLNFLTDITERKRAEEEIKKSLEKERELSELRSRFISMASHEFKTPLTSIMSSAEIIEKYSGQITEEQKNKNLHRIQDNVKHMTQLLNDVLFIGKTEAGKLELKRESVDLKQLCRNTVEQFELSNLKNNQHEIIFEENNLLEEVFLDPKMIRQILDNLISNAIKYSPSGGKVIFEAGCKDSQIYFNVKDSGIGIPAEDQKRLFEPFHRAGNVGVISGTGLGLAIVKNSVEAHGGTNHRLKVSKKRNFVLY